MVSEKLEQEIITKTQQIFLQQPLYTTFWILSSMGESQITCLLVILLRMKRLPEF